MKVAGSNTNTNKNHTVSRNAAAEQKHLNDAIEDTLAINNLILANAPIGILVYESTGQCITASPAAARITGGSITQLREQNFRKLKSWKRDGLLKAAEEALATNTLVRREMHSITTFGKESWYEACFIPYLSQKSKRLMLLIQDIGQRKLAEQKLQESEQKYRMMLEGSPEGIIVIDLKTKRFQYANSAICRMLGYDEAELLQMGVKQIHPPEQLQNALREFKAQSTGEKILVRDIPCLRKDGSVFYADIRSTPVTISDKPMMVGFFIDNSERYRTEAALKDSEWRNKIVSEMVTDYVFVVDVEADGNLRLRWASDRMYLMTGRTVEDAATPDMWKSIVHPDDLLQFYGFVAKVVTEGQAGEFECRTFTKQGEQRWVRIFARPQPGDGRAVSFIIGACQDITERKRVELAMRKAEEEHLNQMRRLARDTERLLEEERANVSRHLHDGVGQSLTSLKMHLAWLEPRIRALNLNLGDELKRAGGQIGQMIDEVRAVAKKLRPVAIEHEGLIDAIRSYINEFQRLSRIQCRLVVQPRDLVVKEPPATAVYRILQEAMTNVARHSQASRCDIRLRVSRDRLELTVHDNGVGANSDVVEGRQSLGVLGMKERASAVDGDVQVKKGPKGGVQVKASFPLVNNQ